MKLIEGNHSMGKFKTFTAALRMTRLGKKKPEDDAAKEAFKKQMKK